MDYSVDKVLYERFSDDKPLHDALIAYEKHFGSSYPLNFIRDSTVEDIRHAIATNTEWELDTHGGTRIY